MYQKILYFALHFRSNFDETTLYLCRRSSVLCENFTVNANSCFSKNFTGWYTLYSEQQHHTQGRLKQSVVRFYILFAEDITAIYNTPLLRT